MSKKLFYNNNHRKVRCLKTGSKHIIERDYSGHYGTVCDMCGKEIFGESPYSIEITDTKIVSNLKGEIHEKDIPQNPKEKLIDILIAGNRQNSDYCHTCVGKLEDWKQKFNSNLKT